MTLEDLTTEHILDMSAEELKSLTDEQFMKSYAEKYLKITRPELADKPNTSKTTRTLGDTRSARQAKFDLVSSLAKSMGIDLDFD